MKCGLWNGLKLGATIALMLAGLAWWASLVIEDRA